MIPHRAAAAPSSVEAATAAAQALHAHYERLTGNRCTLSYQRLTAWHEYIRRGLTADDLIAVVRYIRREMGRPGSGYSPASLQFSRLIQDTDLFEDRLNLARQSWRKADRPETHLSRPPTDPSQSEISDEEDAAARAEICAQLRALRLSLQHPEPQQ